MADEVSTRRTLLISTALFLVGMSARLFLLDAKSLWADEAYAAGLMHRSISELVRFSFQSSPHPPLAFLFLRLSTMVFGTSEAGMRALPALFSALAAVPLFLFASRKLGEKGALLVGAVWALSPYGVSTGQEAWLYGTMAFFGFLFVLVADVAWGGSRAAMVILAPLGLLGMLMQHLFLLFVLCGFTLYLTLPRDKRCAWRALLIPALALTVLYLPFVLSSFEQAGLRTQRLAAAGILQSAPLRMAHRIPEIYAQILAGGVVQEINSGLFGSLKAAAVFLVSLAMTLAAVLSFLADRTAARQLRIWAACWFTIPMLLFLNEDPTARHLSVLWAPLALGIGTLGNRSRPLSAAALLLSLVLLVNYYRIPWFPYHRSDYRTAASMVLGEMREGQRIAVLGGQCGGLAWDYYAGTGVDRFAIGGETPYDLQPVTSRFDRVAFLDSLIMLGGETWVVHDIWAPPEGEDLVSGHAIILHRRISPAMEVLLVSE